MRHVPHAFWRFSLQVYGASGVQEACLALQEVCGADVNLLLLCDWVGHGGRSLDKCRPRQAMARVGKWQSEVISPARKARRAIRLRYQGLLGRGVRPADAVHPGAIVEACCDPARTPH